MNLNNIVNNKTLSDCFLHIFTLLDIITDFRNCLKIYYIDSFLFTLMTISIISPYIVYWSSHYHFEHIIDCLSVVISDNNNFKSLAGFLSNKFFYIILILLSTPIIGIFFTMIEILVFYFIIFIKPFVEITEYFLKRELEYNTFFKNIFIICNIKSEDANRYFVILELFYESVPQLILQTYIFYHLSLIVGSYGDNYTLTKFDLFLSIGCAVANIFINIICLCRSADKFGLNIFTYFPYFMGSKISKVYNEAIPVKNWMISNYKVCNLGRINDFYISEMLDESIYLLQDYSKCLGQNNVNKKIIIPIHVEESKNYSLVESELNLHNICLFGQTLRKLCTNNKIFVDFSIDNVTIVNFKDELIEFTSSPSLFWLESFAFSLQNKSKYSNSYITYSKNIILGRNKEFRNEGLLNLESLIEERDTFNNFFDFIIPMFDIYNCFYRSSNMISYIICISLFSEDKDLNKIRNIIFNIWNNLNLLNENHQKIFLLNEKIISEVFRYLTIISKNNVTDLSSKNIDIDENTNDIKDATDILTKFCELVLEINLKHLPNIIEESLFNSKIEDIRNLNSINLGEINLHNKEHHIFTESIFKINVEHHSSLYFKLFIFREGEKLYLNIGKNNMNQNYLNFNIKTDNLWYFIKENNSNRTCNFNRFTSNKVAAVNFSFDYDGYIIVSNNNKYTLSIKKSEDLFGSIEDWNQFKISGHLISSQMIVNHYNESDYVLTISERNNDDNNFIYISNTYNNDEIV